MASLRRRGLRAAPVARWAPALTLLLVLLAVLAGFAGAGSARAQPPSLPGLPVAVPSLPLPGPLPVPVAPPPSPAVSPATRSADLHRAEQGIDGQAGRWRTSQHGWFCEQLGCPGAYPLLTIWGVVRMFEAADAVELADPSPAHRATVDWYAGQSLALYWNHYLRGYDPYPGDDYPAAQAWFDDNGWLGLAFIDAYRATGERRWAAAAQRAFDFIAARGWRSGGGIWWNTQHQQLSGEALAADSLLGVLLHRATGNRADLDRARSWVDWANGHSVGFHGLYVSDGPHSTTISYVQAPLIYAQYLLCQALHVDGYCAHAAAQSQALTQVYGIRYQLSPLYDSIFFQWMMAYDRASGDRHWIDVARANADAASAHAAQASGLWLGSWWGGPITDPNTHPGMFRTMAGTTSLFAWLAADE